MAMRAVASLPDARNQKSKVGRAFSLALISDFRLGPRRHFPRSEEREGSREDQGESRSVARRQSSCSFVVSPRGRGLLLRPRDLRWSVPTNAPLQRGNCISERRPNALERGGVDGPGIEVEIEAGHVLAEDLDLPPGFVEHALHDIGNHRAVDSLYRDLWQGARRHDVTHDGIGLVADDDMSG